MARIDDFKARFPSFDTAVVDSLFPVVEPVSSVYFGGDYDANPLEREMFMQLWAHMITIESKRSGDSVRNKSSKAVGSVSVSYEASQSESGRLGWFNTTKYGQQFVLLSCQTQGAVFV